MKEVQLEAPGISTISAHMTKLRKLGRGTIECVFKGQQVSYVCLQKARTSSLQLRCIFWSWKSRFWYRWWALAAPQKQHLMRALAATCFSGEHSITQDYLWWMPSSIWHLAWTCQTLSRTMLGPESRVKNCFISSVFFLRLFGRSWCFQKNVPQQESTKGQASWNVEIQRNFWQPKDQPVMAAIASNGSPNSHGGQLSSWKLPRPIHHLSMLLWQDLNDHHLDAKWIPNLKAASLGGAHKKAINPCCGVCVEGLLHMTICLKCGYIKSS